mgnify:CR=1 FL=1
MKNILLLLLIVSNSTYSEGFWSDLKTITGGHIKDIANRFQDDQIIDGKVVATGVFNEEADGQDFAHNGKGSATIKAYKGKKYLQLGKDFYSSPGPDYHVYVSDKTNINNEKDFLTSKQVELGALIKGSGASYYELPANTPSDSVTIWCKEFNEYIASADIIAH